MCDPATMFAASVGISAVTEGINFIQANANADALEEHQRVLHDQNVEIATENALSAFASLSRRESQEREAAAAAISDVSLQSRQAMGTLAASAAQAGVAGNTVAVLLQDFERQELDFQNRELRNLRFSSQNLEDQRREVTARFQGQVLQTIPQPVPRPNPINSAIKIGGAAFGSFQDFSFFNESTGSFQLGRPSNLGGG